MPHLLERLKSALADRYVIESEIGRGGMATVFLAEDLKHHRKVAIKVLHPELAAAVGSDRFLREIQIAAKLEHPHILALIDSGEADGLPYYVMPYVEGESLRDLLKREAQLPIEQALTIAAEVADGLDYAHRQGVVHRDIKPGNILLAEGHARIADFGVARALGAASERDATATGLTVGTPKYMSPEQATGEAVDGRSDVYALGCVLYEMLAGDPPYDGPTPLAILAQKAGEYEPDLRVHRKSVPPGMAAAIARAMAPTQADRYATAVEFAAQLKAPASPGAARATRSLFRRFLVAAATIVLLAAVAWLVPGSPDTGPAGDADGNLNPNSVAVLPFVNMSDDASNEYFSDGISEELLNLLAKIPELRVPSRTSAFSFKADTMELPEIARRLKVAHILEGSVRKAGDQVRITVQLVDARSDTPLWSHSWDRTLEDVFAVQDEIAAAVVGQLEITLLGSVQKVRQTDPEAYTMFLQARELSHRLTEEDLGRSIELQRQVLAIDPEYAPAWAELARMYASQADRAWRPADEAFRLAREAAHRALEIDPGNASAHAQLGRIETGPDGDLQQAASHYSRALELDPTNPDIVFAAGRLAANLGRLDEAIMAYEYAIARDPVNAAYYRRLGLTKRWAGRLDEAIDASRTALRLSEEIVGAHYHIGMDLLLQGNPEAALEAVLEEPVENEALRLLGLSKVYHALGRQAESDSALAEVIRKHEQGWAYNIAYAYAIRGEPDLVFEWLGRAVQYGDSGIQETPVENFFTNIHDDPRWIPFLESIGRSPQQLAAIEFEVRLPQ